MIISDMMSSAADYNAYVKNVLARSIDKNVLSEITALEERGDQQDPHYMKLLISNFYAKFFLQSA